MVRLTFFTLLSSVIPSIDIRRLCAVLYSVRFWKQTQQKIVKFWSRATIMMAKNVLHQVPFEFLVSKMNRHSSQSSVCLPLYYSKIVHQLRVALSEYSILNLAICLTKNKNRTNDSSIIITYLVDAPKWNVEFMWSCVGLCGSICKFPMNVPWATSELYFHFILCKYKLIDLATYYFPNPPDKKYLNVCDKHKLHGRENMNCGQYKNHSVADSDQIDNISSRQSSISELVCHPW